MPIPTGFSTVNPFIVTRDADGLITFLAHVFDGVDRPEARTVDTDGLLLHAELQIGDTTVMFGDRKPDWPFLPALLQIYVDDVERVTTRAAAAGATVVTEPTDFFSQTLARILDPWHNLWWLYSIPEDADETWEGPDGSEDSETWQPTPELSYIHDTLLRTIPTLRARDIDG